MKLTQCPACTNAVSTTAKTCPHCGQILKKAQSATGLLAAIIIGLIFGFFVLSCESNVFTH